VFQSINFRQYQPNRVLFGQDFSRAIKINNIISETPEYAGAGIIQKGNMTGQGGGGMAGVMPYIAKMLGEDSGSAVPMTYNLTGLDKKKFESLPFDERVSAYRYELLTNRGWHELQVNSQGNWAWTNEPDGQPVQIKRKVPWADNKVIEFNIFHHFDEVVQRNVFGITSFTKLPLNTSEGPAACLFESDSVYAPKNIANIPVPQPSQVISAEDRKSYEAHWAKQQDIIEAAFWTSGTVDSITQAADHLNTPIRHIVGQDWTSGAIPLTLRARYTEAPTQPYFHHLVHNPRMNQYIDKLPTLDPGLLPTGGDYTQLGNRLQSHAVRSADTVSVNTEHYKFDLVQNDLLAVSGDSQEGQQSITDLLKQKAEDGRLYNMNHTYHPRYVGNTVVQELQAALNANDRAQILAIKNREKAKFQEVTGLSQDQNAVLVVSDSRLDRFQKEALIFIAVVEKLLASKAPWAKALQFAIIQHKPKPGEDDYISGKIDELTQNYPGRFVQKNFDIDLAIQAGLAADTALFMSSFEPIGTGDINAGTSFTTRTVSPSGGLRDKNSDPDQRLTGLPNNFRDIPFQDIQQDTFMIAEMSDHQAFLKLLKAMESEKDPAKINALLEAPLAQEATLSTIKALKRMAQMRLDQPKQWLDVTINSRKNVEAHHAEAVIAPIYQAAINSPKVSQGSTPLWATIPQQEAETLRNSLMLVG
jgi:hypothetical protein